ncbi:transglutaminase domain-containing protein [Candidatus Woesearchaeota archaeon]|nr:transglutaminase domain-containing protein [Candidatus Woesearchaeota archaeon]
MLDIYKKDLDAEELERVEAWCKLSNKKFLDGLILGKYASQVLGYNTKISLKVKFRHIIDGEPTAYSGPSFISLDRRMEWINPSFETENIERLPDGSRKYHVKHMDIDEDGIELLFRLYNNHLSDPLDSSSVVGANSNRLVDVDMFDTHPDIDEFLKRHDVFERRGQGSQKFTWGILRRILEGMAKELRYDLNGGPDHSFTPLEVINKKTGVCGDFARTLCHLVYFAGGDIRLQGGVLLNLKSGNYDVLPTLSNLGESHGWTEVFKDRRYHLVDPTLYISQRSFTDRRYKRFVGDSCNHAYIIPTSGFRNVLYTKEPNLKCLSGEICSDSVRRIR